MSNLEISESIPRYSMDMAAVRVSSAVQASMLKNVMELERATMAQLLQSMGVGGALDVRA